MEFHPNRCNISEYHAMKNIEKYLALKSRKGRTFAHLVLLVQGLKSKCVKIARIELIAYEYGNSSKFSLCSSACAHPDSAGDDVTVFLDTEFSVTCLLCGEFGTQSHLHLHEAFSNTP